MQRRKLSTIQRSSGKTIWQDSCMTYWTIAEFPRFQSSWKTKKRRRKNQERRTSRRRSSILPCQSMHFWFDTIFLIEFQILPKYNFADKTLPPEWATDRQQDESNFEYEGPERRCKGCFEKEWRNKNNNENGKRKGNCTWNGKGKGANWEREECEERRTDYEWGVPRRATVQMEGKCWIVNLLNSYEKLAGETAKWWESIRRQKGRQRGGSQKERSWNQSGANWNQHWWWCYERSQGNSEFSDIYIVLLFLRRFLSSWTICICILHNLWYDNFHYSIFK